MKPAVALRIQRPILSTAACMVVRCLALASCHSPFWPESGSVVTGIFFKRCSNNSIVPPGL